MWPFVSDKKRRARLKAELLRQICEHRRAEKELWKKIDAIDNYREEKPAK